MKKNYLLILLLPLILAVAPVAAQSRASVTMLHFSDYHSHAVPFYAEGQADTAGIGRLIAYLQPYANDPNSLIFSGGDTMNLGTPAWSDKYTCTEWEWFNGIVDAMAYGNHDADYGPDEFGRCRGTIDYPILSSNTIKANGQPIFQDDGKTYKIFEIDGVKIGVFALAGPDFDRLVRPNLRPEAGAVFSDRVAVARQVVAALREQERVNAVVLIGHALYEDDIALAQAVPGIDLIFGTHSHRKEELFKIPGANTWMISSFQYAAYLSKVTFEFSNGALSNVSGGLVQLDTGLLPEPRIVEKVTRMQAELQADPKYAALFQAIGASQIELSTDGQFTGEALLGNFVLDIARDTIKTHMVLATASGFREPIAPGTLTEEGFRTAMPYKNRLLIYSMTGAQIQQLLNYSVSRTGSDFFSQVSGVRFAISGKQASDIQILKDPANPASGYAPLDPAATYSVATSDFQGKFAGGYKEIFAPAPFRDAGIDDLRDIVRAYIQANSPVSAKRDGRIRQASTQPALPPAQLPTTGGIALPGQALALLAGLLLTLGVVIRYNSRKEVMRG